MVDKFQDILTSQSTSLVKGKILSSKVTRFWFTWHNQSSREQVSESSTRCDTDATMMPNSSKKYHRTLKMAEVCVSSCAHTEETYLSKTGW